MKTPQLLFLTLVMLQAAVSGCQSPTQGVQFSEVPDSMFVRPAPREATAALDVVGAQPGLERTALVEAIRKAMGASSEAYPEVEMMRDAQKLADWALARDKVTLRVPRDLAGGVARKLEEAGLIVRLSE
jgi:hypothetical protein